jgi:hypothetical protein
MSSYEVLVSMIASWALLYGGWKVASKGGGFFSLVGLTLFVGFAFVVAVGIPRFIAHEKGTSAKRETVKPGQPPPLDVQMQHIRWAPNAFKIKVGKEPTVERIQTALAEVREDLRQKGMPSTDQQWHKFVSTNMAVKWDGSQWVRDEARWYQQWKR